jgi:hypothetical protein
MLNIGTFRRKIKLYEPSVRVNSFGETEINGYNLRLTCFAKRRDIEWSTIGEESHGKQLVVEARTEFYIKKFRPAITEQWLVEFNNKYYELTRVDEFGNGEYTRLLGLRRDNFTPTIL